MTIDCLGRIKKMLQTPVDYEYRLSGEDQEDAQVDHKDPIN